MGVKIANWTGNNHQYMEEDVLACFICRLKN